MNNKLTLKILLIILALLSLAYLLSRGVFLYKAFDYDKYESITTRELALEIIDKKISKIIVDNDKLEIHLKNGTLQKSRTYNEPNLIESLKRWGVSNSEISKLVIETKKPSFVDYIINNLGPLIVPVLVLVGSFIWLSNIIRRMINSRRA